MTPDLRRRAPAAAALVLFSASFAIFLAGPYRGSGDTEPAELLPISLLSDGRLDFDRFYGTATDLPYAFRRVRGHVVSAYPIAAGIANVPVFAVARVARVDLYAHRLELSHVTAALAAAASAVFLFLALGRLCVRRGTPIVFASVYVLGTEVWSVAGRGLWQHTPSLLSLSAALWLLTFRERGRLSLAGLALGLAVVSRPTNLPIAAAAALFVLVRRRPALPGFLAAAAVPALLVTAYSGSTLGRLLAFGALYRSPRLDGPILPGLLGLLFSPSRGLFLFSPVLLASAPGAWIAWRSRDSRWEAVRWLAPAAGAAILLHAAWPMWWGGASFGYRIILDVVPILILLAAAAWEAAAALPRRLRRAARTAFAILFVASVYVELLGILAWPTSFETNLDLEPARLWSVRGSELVLASRKLFRGREAASVSPDSASTGTPAVWWTPALDDETIPGWVDGSPGGRTVRGALSISGWAKSSAGEVDVRLALDDGRVVQPERYPRPDVASVLPELGDTARAGFRATIPRRNGLSEAHALSVELRAPSGRVRRFGPIRFRWAD